MRTAEVALGLLIVAAAVALALGAGRLVAPLPAPGLGLTLALISIGLTIATHGLSGRAESGTQAKSWRAAFYISLAISSALVLPLAVDALDVTVIAGFPLGYYFAAQGLLIVFAILSFRAAQFFDSRDRAHEDS